MNTMRLHFSKSPLNYLRLTSNLHNKNLLIPNIASYYATTIDSDVATEIIERYRSKQRCNDLNALSIRYFMGHTSDPIDVSKLSEKELQKHISELLYKNKDSQVEQILLDCRKIRKFIGEAMLTKLFRHYSNTGKPDMVAKVQKYCLKTDLNLYRRGGEFMHYVAKAECLKGNSEKGLAILKECYQKYEGIRSFYRIIFRELIQDSVLNRSEASLVTFKKYVIEFSETWNDHYPLICLWHICWTSNWFSDQVLADELLEHSEELRSIVSDKAAAFSITSLRDQYNDDAVMRLLQALLKYNMKESYSKVLHILFNFRLRNKDLRGCTEIIKNCEILGITLSGYQQGKYIKLLIDGKAPIDKQPESLKSKDFKLKF